jgi:ferredoxin-NADP reductase
MPTTLHFVRRQHEAENATTFYFRPETPLGYEAGQYLRYTLPHSDPDDRGIVRSFTLSSFPEEPLLSLTTRLSTPPSSFKAALAALEPGAALEANGPFGRFVYTPTDLLLAFIAGGIGVTPFRSILGDLAARGTHARVVLLYSNGTSDIPFRTFLDGLRPGWPELQLVYTVTGPDPTWRGPTARIDAEFIRQHVPDLARTRFFTSGPAGLVGAMRATLAGMGVPSSRITFEAFPGYDRR